jgi:hypothetical protein
MFILKKLAWIGIFIQGIILMGCTPNSMYRPIYTTCVVTPKNTCDEHALQIYNQDTDNEYLLGFIEINDDGHLWDRSQMLAQVNAIKQISQENGVLIAVFVHGWHHSASPYDDNVRSFRTKLLPKLVQIAHRESKAFGSPPRKVIGVYIGWRGESVNLFPFDYFTYLERKSTAQDVGYFGVTEALAYLEGISNIRNSEKSQSNNRMIVFGHSFGGAIVYNAISQILTLRLIKNLDGNGSNHGSEGFGDLVVLLNPAFDALRFVPFYSLTQLRCNSPQLNPTPKLVILTSEADSATGIAYSFERVFSALFKTDYDIKLDGCNNSAFTNGHIAKIHTVGHFRPLITHTLTPLKYQNNIRIFGDDNIVNFWSGQIQGGATKFGSTVLTHLNKTLASNPYLNIRVDEDIIQDHNDILNDKIMDFIGSMIEISTVN